MAYFLRNLAATRPDIFTEDYQQFQGSDALNLDNSGIDIENSNRESRKDYSKLLLICSKALHHSGVLQSGDAARNSEGTSESTKSSSNDEKSPCPAEDVYSILVPLLEADDKTRNELDNGLASDVSEFIHVAAAPSGFGANMLARTAVLRCRLSVRVENERRPLDMLRCCRGMEHQLTTASTIRKSTPRLYNQPRLRRTIIRGTRR